MKIVIDTNVLMSALFFGGLAEKLVNLVLLNINVFTVKLYALKHHPHSQKHAHALLPANPDYAGESVHGAELLD
jgi:hypothetical protein